jgi:ligand-binding sensor domain-containing protein
MLKVLTTFDYMFLMEIKGSKWLRRVSLLVFLSINSLSHGQNFRYTQFGLEEGLPQSQVFGLLQDHRGYLWAGTRGGGLSQFDGTKFRTFQSRDGLVNNFINCLFLDSDSLLWIGTDNGISSYDGRKFTTLPLKTIADLKVLSISEISDKNTLLVGTENGLFFIQNDSIKKIEIDAQEPFYVLDIVPNKSQTSFFVATNRGVFEINSRKFQVVRHLNRQNGLPVNYTDCVFLDKNDNLFIGTVGGGLCLYSNNVVKRIFDDLPKNLIIYDIVKEGSILWIATQYHGIYRLNLQTQRSQNLTSSNGLTNNHVRCLVLDRWGGVWLGSSGGGLGKFSGQRFTHYTTKDGLADDYIYSVFEDKYSNIWLGTGSNGLCKKDSQGVISIVYDSLLQTKKIKAIAQYNDTTIVVGTEGQGLCLIYPNTTQWISMRDGLVGNYIKDLESSPDGTLWIATLDGGMSAMRVTGSTLSFTNYKYLTHLPTQRIFSLHCDSNGVTWFGTENHGLGKVQNGQVYMVLDASSIDYQSIRAIRSDDRGGVWMATSNGLFHLKKGHFSAQKIAKKELKSNNLYLLEFGSEFELYVGSERGVDKLLFNQSYELIDQETYGILEGFEGIETCQNAVDVDENGNLWFGTIGGLTKLNVNWTQNTMVAPEIWLDDVDLFYETLQDGDYNYALSKWNTITQPPIFKYNKNHLSFRLSGINLSDPNQVLYRWKLEGNDEDWAPLSKRSDATYSNLSPGNYTFLYQAQNQDGKSSAVKKWSFTIKTPYWKTWWFYTLVSVFIIGIILLSIRFYIRRIKEAEKVEREKLAFEKDLIELEQKALRLQMNPHFMYNALNSIQGLVASQQHTQARTYLQKFARLMRLTLQNSRADFISLEDEIESLKNYLDLEQLTQKKAFQYTFAISPNMNVGDVLIPPMMLQPFLENAVKHGVADMGELGLIKINFDIDQNNILTCTIADNGIGREEAGKKTKNRGKSHESTAIQVTKERLAILNRESPGNSLIINDLSQGTAVIITLYVG